MNNVNVREYQPGDSKKIFTLFNQYTTYERDAKFWVWINRLLSDKKSIIVVGDHNNNIVGHYAIIPQEVSINGKVYQAAFAIHAFIHPDYRNSFLIMQITKKMYKIAKEQGIDFIYGFPNENFREIQIKADRWKEVSLFNALEKTSLTYTDTNYSIIPVNDTYEDIYALSELLDVKVDNDDVCIKKSLNYYLNRYIRHPQNLYRNFFIVHNDIKVGFVCLKFYKDDTNEVGHIIDYLNTDAINFQDILTFAENYFCDKASKISVWKFNEQNKTVLLNNNFKESGFQTFLGVKLLNKNEDLENKLTNFSNWQLCMGDSDAF